MPLSSARPDPVAMPGFMPERAAGALWQWPPMSVLACSVVVAVLMSTQYLVQPFVWRFWPWDEVLLGWFEVVRDRVVVAVAIGLALIAASRPPLSSLRSRTAALALAILVGAAIGELGLVAGGAPGAPGDAVAVLGHVARWSIVAGCVAAMWYVWRSAAETRGAAQAIELRRVRLEHQTTEARLEALRGQIEPHFLFNTLATVRRLHQIEPAQGAQLLAHFVDYLRSAQPAAQGGSTLGQEIDLTRAYLGVVAQRMNGRLQVQFEVAEELRTQPFPPLTIATLVENAVKHGIGPAPAGGTITVTVGRGGGWLNAVVTDTGVGFSGSSGSGIGLANIRARLHTLYGNAGTLSLHTHQPSGVRAAMRLPCLPRRQSADAT
jgi:Histidine kinase